MKNEQPMNERQLREAIGQRICENCPVWEDCQKEEFHPICTDFPKMLGDILSELSDLIKKLDMTAEKCPECDGAGYKERHSDGLVVVRGRIPCHTCNGTGSVWNLDRLVVVPSVSVARRIKLQLQED